MAKKRVGRPSIPKAKQRSHRLTLGLTAEELREAEGLAKEQGVSASVWARAVVVRALKRGKR